MSWLAVDKGGCEHSENENFDYMRRFVKIFNKLKQL